MLLFAYSPAAHAGLEAAAKKPYNLQVVLHIGVNRVFTPLFQEQLQSDVQNQLKLAFGDLARIEVVRTHPLLHAIEQKGLESALESWTALSEQTTHFVLLDYVAGAYQIRARGHDGGAGLAGALTASKQIADRASVASAIARLVEESFSPAGAVTEVVPGGKTATLTLQGGELGVPLDRWVQRGHVFAVCRLASASGKLRSERLEWALLEVVDGPAKGVCHCRYRHRYQEDALKKGDRAVHLPTTKAPLKLQLLDDTTLKPLDAVRVRIQSSDDKAKPDERLTDKDGLVERPGVYDHLAWVQVLSGDQVRAQFPVEMIPGRPMVARVKLQADRESLTSLEVRRDAWLRRSYDNVRLSADRLRDLSAQLNVALEAARDAGRKSLPDLEAEIAYLDREADELDRLAKEKKATTDLTEGQQQIDELRKQAKALQEFVERIDGVLKDAAGDEKALGVEKLIGRAQLLYAEADFDGAIRLYSQVVAANPSQIVKVRSAPDKFQTVEVKAILDELKRGWAIKNDAHRSARVFIYETWPGLDLAGLGKQMKDAASALEACKQAGDKLTAQKLLQADVVHMVNLKKQLETLKRRDTEDNRNQAKILAQTTRALLLLHQDASAFTGVRPK